MTVCVKERKEWFGEIKDGRMDLNQRGGIVLDCWNDLPGHYGNVQLDVFVVMPNHVHGVIVIDNNIVGNGLKPFPTRRHGLSEIIRGEKDLNRIREYIVNNPLQWDEDLENKNNAKKQT